MKYRKPMKDVQDRHALIELGGDFTNDEIRHILNHAYLEHKAPHEYDELKKYIKDLVIGKHNSVYIMNNGNPNPLASALTLASPYISNLSGSLYYDFCGAANYTIFCFPTNNATNCNSNANGYITWWAYIIKYNNGTALQWALFYTYAPFINKPGGLYVTLSPYGNGQLAYTMINATFGYAPYITSTNPLTLTTYFYWNPGSSSYSYSYVYFTINLSNYAYANDGIFFAMMPFFYSTGQYNFNSGTYYISMWQWTYS